MADYIDIKQTKPLDGLRSGVAYSTKHAPNEPV